MPVTGFGPFVAKMVLTILYLCWLCSISKVKADIYFQKKKKKKKEHLKEFAGKKLRKNWKPYVCGLNINGGIKSETFPPLIPQSTAFIGVVWGSS